MAGYHLKVIGKGVVGEPSKILEEFQEWEDARLQGCKVMELVELSDLLGAIESYIQDKYNLELKDLQLMSDITKRAFKEGARS